LARPPGPSTRWPKTKAQNKTKGDRKTKRDCQTKADPKTKAPSKTKAAPPHSLAPKVPKTTTPGITSNWLNWPKC